MNKFEKILLTTFFIELFVGGGGRLIDFHVISIRQLLFLLLLLTYVYRIVKEKAIFNKEINTFFRLTPVSIGIYCLLGWFVVSSLIGFVHGHPKGAIITNFLRVTFFVLYFPLAYYISKDRFPVKRIITILKYSALAVAIFTITVSLLGKTIFSGNNFRPFYDFMNWMMNDDLFFRPSNSVFYKSHFYVLVGVVLSMNDLLNKKFTKSDLAIVILGGFSLIWSETRGFLLAFMLIVFLIIVLDMKIIVDPLKGLSKKLQKLIQSKQFIKKFVILLVIMVAVPFLFQNMTLERFGNTTIDQTSTTNVKGHKNQETQVNDVSVNARMKFIVASKDILKHPTNLVFGTGYGTTIAGRITGIEMSFLQILVEQGIIGFATWLFLFFIFYYNYYVAYKKGYKLTTLDISLMATFMGILLLTNINPFINNPIGIGFFLILLVISQNKKQFRLKEEFE
ncbi:O-antigen ligase family protein [Neobacillus pocheonensis]|uniref:O-antigen ligase family protein n=1 Tax=Neobacillus pocheonensis TaxID=363869 RepID=A0ABT0WI91_9BACI|nr:O-antigen ligase family protein [Neobacillus pocheonensis]